MSTPLNNGLRFILPDGSYDTGKIEAVARTRAVTHSRAYGEDMERAYRGERQGVEADASGERQIWEARAIRAGLIVGVTITGRTALELSTDLPVGGA